MQTQEDGDHDQEDEVDPEDIPELDHAGSSSSSANLPSSSLSLLVKPQDEQYDIQVEMTDLEHAVPELGKNYRLVDRLGSGTFSSVYKAVDLNYENFDNLIWERGNYAQPTTAPFYVEFGEEVRVYTDAEVEKKRSSGRVYVAVKRIYVTSGPERVRNELAIMEDCMGCRHTSQLIEAFRHRDQVVAIMPYCRNDDFRVRPWHMVALKTRRVLILEPYPASTTSERYLYQQSNSISDACSAHFTTYTRVGSSTAT